jgi:polar amino acid transport system permease protein
MAGGSAENVINGQSETCVKEGKQKIDVQSYKDQPTSLLGMSRGRTFRRIVLPQAMRFVVPPTGSQVISMLKATSLVSVIALADLR